MVAHRHFPGMHVHSAEFPEGADRGARVSWYMHDAWNTKG